MKCTCGLYTEARGCDEPCEHAGPPLPTTVAKGGTPRVPIVFLLLLVVLVATLVRSCAARADTPRICRLFVGMDRSCESVRSMKAKFGKRGAEWIARRCGATDADIEQAKTC